MASSSYMKDSRNELTCAVCLQLFEEPITLPCGHSFCLNCLENYWDSREEPASCFCPNCREVFLQKPKLKKSVILASLVEQMKLRESEDSPKVVGQAEAKNDERDDAVKVGGYKSQCYSCRKMATMWCVPCEILCCERHVKPHKHKGHKLVEPEMKEEVPGCIEHRNSIHFYCKDDESLVSLIHKGEHQDHEVVPVEIALSEFKVLESVKKFSHFWIIC